MSPRFFGHRFLLILGLSAVFFSMPLYGSGQLNQQNPKKPPLSSAKKVPTTSGYDLKAALGGDFNSFAKVFKVKITPKSGVIPDMEPGVNYSDEERAALPQIEEWAWTSKKIPGTSSVYLRRTSKESIVKYCSIAFPKGKKLSTEEALKFVKIPIKGLSIEETNDRGVFEISNIIIGKNRWLAYYLEENDDELSELQISWEEWIP